MFDKTSCLEVSVYCMPSGNPHEEALECVCIG